MMDYYNTCKVLSVLRGARRVFDVHSVAQSCPTHCDPMVSSTPGFPVHGQLLELYGSY